MKYLMKVTKLLIKLTFIDSKLMKYGQIEEENMYEQKLSKKGNKMDAKRRLGAGLKKSKVPPPFDEGEGSDGEGEEEESEEDVEEEKHSQFEEDNKSIEKPKDKQCIFNIMSFQIV